MSEHLFILTICLFLGVIPLVLGMKYGAAAYQARLKAKADDAYRDLAEKALSVQTAAAASLSAIQAELSGVASRLTAVEKLLKDVG